MTRRLDVSKVPLQGGYIAKRCPARIQYDMREPGDPLPPPDDVLHRMREGNRFEDETFVAIESAGSGAWRALDGTDPAEIISATTQAMEARSPIIAGGWLPADSRGRRTGRPDLLVWAGDGYVPVDVKHHRTLDIGDGEPALVSEFADPTPSSARPVEGRILRKHKGDALQLAHYRRMLQSCGHAASRPTAGIIGKEGVIVWYDLDAPIWQTPAKSDGRKRKQRTSMEVYDFEFDFRLDIAATALVDDSHASLLVEPIKCSECPSCPWRDYCGLLLEKGDGDPSLLPGIAYPQWRTLRDRGITDRDGVALLDHFTAVLGASGVDLPKMLALAADASRSAPIADLHPRAKKQQRVLAAAGIETAGEILDRLDPETAALVGASWLPEAILNARAALGDHPVHRRPDGSAPPLQRFDVEIDIDMENTPDGVYLWGALVTDRADTGLVEEGYHPFVTWEPLSGPVEEELFESFWSWLAATFDKVESKGHTVAAYCWYDGAENPEMRRLAAHSAQLADAVETFLRSPRWIDLHREFLAGWITGGAGGLKTIAALAGFDWTVDDPGGAHSLLKHAEAIGEVSEDAKRWLLDYNRGDVEATLAVRDWLSEQGGTWPVIETGPWTR